VTTAPVSVIIPCFNCSGTIERALASVLGQTLLPAEIFLVDDGSDDHGRTSEILSELKRRHEEKASISVISLRVNNGPSAARNAGWDAATQSYIAFLDADDAWHPRKIEIQYRWMEDHPDVALTGHPCLWIRSGIAASPLPSSWDAHEVRRIPLLFSNRFQTPSVMLRRSIPYRFRLGMDRCEDYLLWLRMVLNGHKAWRIELPLAFIFKPPFGRAGLSRNVWKLSRGEMIAFGLAEKEGLIKKPARLLITTYIFLKYLRRLCISLFSGILSFYRSGWNKT
jgi:glycosyltransferase involved in cell wall biosynthesis